MCLTEQHRELSCRSTPPAFTRFADDCGDSPADLAAATNSLPFEGNDRKFRRPAPFRRPVPSLMVYILLEVAPLLAEKINENVGTT